MKIFLKSNLFLIFVFLGVFGESISDELPINFKDEIRTGHSITQSSKIAVKLKAGISIFDIRKAVPGTTGEPLLEKMRFYSNDRLSQPKNSLDSKRSILINRLDDIFYLKNLDLGAEDFKKRLIASGLVHYAEFPQIHQLHQVTEPGADPLLINQNHFGGIGMNPYDENLPDASDIIIAIVDSGTDTEHVDLIENLYINPGEIPDNGIDDDNNGYVDDVSGWDFVGNLTAEQAENDDYQPDNDPRPNHPSNSHGTHVAGCASAVNFNSVGIAATGRGAQILPIKTASDNMDELYGIYNGFEAILYAAYMGADIINCSWGGGNYSQYEWDIIKAVDETGSIIISSAGNSAWNNDLGMSYPTAFPEVISVGASENDVQPAGFSNYGLSVDVFGPGVQVYATLPDDTYGGNSGTSMSSPVIAGMAAVMKAKFPDMTRDEMRARLRYHTKYYLSSEERLNQYAGIAQIDSILMDDLPASLVVVDKQSSDFIEEQFDIDVYPINGILSNVSLTLEPSEDFYSLSTSQVVESQLDAELSIPQIISFGDDIPWYRGRSSINILGSYDSGNSIDSYGFPFVLDSNNAQHEFLGHPEDLFAVGWRFARKYGEDVWFAGVDYRLAQAIIYNPIAEAEYMLGGYFPTSVYQYQDGSISVAASSDADIVKSDDGFETTEIVDLSNLTTNIQAHIVYEQTDRQVVIGRAKVGSDHLNILVSDDDGETFTMHPISTTLDDDPTTYAETIDYRGDMIVVADSKGRLIYTNDKGLNWNTLNIPQQYTYKLKIAANGQVALLASDDRRYLEKPNLYDINLLDTSGEPLEEKWVMTPAEELPDNLFSYILNFNSVAGMGFQDNKTTEVAVNIPLLLSGAEGSVARRSGAPGEPFKHVRSVRQSGYGHSLLTEFDEDSNFNSFYFASNVVNRLTFPKAGYTPSYEFDFGELEFVDQMPNQRAEISDSAKIGSKLVIKIPFNVAESSDEVFLTLLEQPTGDINLTNYPEGWYDSSEGDSITIEFQPQDKEIVNGVIKYKIGEEIYDIYLSLKGIEPASVRNLTQKQSAEHPYLKDGYIVLHSNSSADVYDINGRAVASGKQEIYISELSPGPYFLHFNSLTYKFIISG